MKGLIRMRLPRESQSRREMTMATRRNDAREESGLADVERTSDGCFQARETK